MLSDKRIIDFEITNIELICRKDTASLIETMILPILTHDLESVATLPFHIYTTDDNEHLKIHCQFGGMVPDCMQQLISINKVDVYVTGDLAFQAMALGREGMSPHHCLHCRMGRSEFKNIDAIGLPWTMKEYIKVGQQSRESGNSQLGVKKEPWW
jgi:hypothetical protein